MNDRVIATGDSLFGSIVTSITFTTPGLNNLGQIAFRADLADGTTGIFRADIQTDPIPEPTTIALLGIGLGGLEGAEVRRRRKKNAVDKS